ncbi:MAG TPA: RcnB family protein [Allosphingosinicella sp.]|jgi:hypothetical protein
MRKALIGLILTATVLTPVAAQAQDREERRARAERTQRSEARGQPNFDRREARQEARVERQEARQEAQIERREARQEYRPRVEPRSEPVQVVQRDRRERANRPGSAYPQAWQGDPNDRMRSHYEQLERRNQYRYGTQEQRDEVRRDWREERRDDRRDWRGDRRDDRRDWRDDRRDDRRDWRDERRDWSRNWNRSWRYDNRYDWNRFRYSNRNVFRGSRYYAPYRNHRYSRFGIGFFLEPLFFNRNYWISNPYYYRLPPAPPGAQWIRYYDDVLLVDTWSGEVIDVIYDFFW